LFTQIDAFYCAKFIQLIHSLKTPNFSTIICYDRIFSDISYSIASLTDNEARRYGHFLLGLLETVMHWHSDSNIFDVECAHFPGFLTVFRNALASSSNNNNTSTPVNKQEQLDYENFRHVCHKWHYKLTKSFIVCLESSEYLQMRNSLIILTKILPHYPRLIGFYSALDKRVEKIVKDEKDKRHDLFTIASVYLGQLRSRKSFMVDEAKFHLKEAISKPITQTATTATTTTTTTTTKTSKTDSNDSKFKQPIKQESNHDNNTKTETKTTVDSKSNSTTSSTTPQTTTTTTNNNNNNTNNIKSNRSSPPTTTTTTSTPSHNSPSRSSSNGSKSSKIQFCLNK
jgi:THO complex subunit 2